MQRTRGFSTLEILIAMSVMFLVLGAVILVSFGNQTAIADSQTDAEALNFAQKLLEVELADARKDFNLVNSGATTSPDGFYTAVTTAELQSDYLTKKVTVKVSWKGDHLRNQSVSLVGLITNFTNAVGANTCNSTPDGDWKNPTLAASYDLATLIGDTTGVYSITDVDAYQGRLYVTAITNVPTKPTFFIFNTSTIAAGPIASIDTTGSTVSSGATAVAVAKNSSGQYAYVANGYAANFNTCTQGLNCSQLEVYNVTNSASPSFVYALKVPTVTSSGQGAGNALSYRDGYVYLGLTATGGQGDELQVIDVHTPASPFVRSHSPIGNAVNSLFVKGLYAYVASPNTQSLKVFDISNPNSIALSGGNSGSGGNGKAIYAVGDSVYLGTAQGNGSLYKLFDASTPSSPAVTASKTFTASVDSIIVRDSLAFVLTKSALQVLNATSTTAWSGAYTLPSQGSVLYEPTMDCEGNTLFVASNDSTDHGKLYIFTPKP